MLAQAPPAASPADISTLVYAATDEHPRYTEGSVLALHDGSLLFAVTEFGGNGSDFAKARIIARTSADGGHTWGEPRVLQENTGRLERHERHPALDRRPAQAGHVAMFYLQKDAYDDLQMFVRFSDDEAQTFGDPILVSRDPGYHVVNNDRVTQLSSGRLDRPGRHHHQCAEREPLRLPLLLFRRRRPDLDRRAPADRSAETRRDGAGGRRTPDGRLLMIIRTQLGFIATSYSRDGGDTWSAAGQLDVVAPEAPATIRRIPATGDLLLSGTTLRPGAGHGVPGLR